MFSQSDYYLYLPKNRLNHYFISSNVVILERAVDLVVIATLLVYIFVFIFTKYNQTLSVLILSTFVDSYFNAVIFMIIQWNMDADLYLFDLSCLTNLKPFAENIDWRDEFTTLHEKQETKNYKQTLLCA